MIIFHFLNDFRLIYDFLSIVIVDHSFSQNENVFKKSITRQNCQNNDFIDYVLHLEGLARFSVNLRFFSKTLLPLVLIIKTRMCIKKPKTQFCQNSDLLDFLQIISRSTIFLINRYIDRFYNQITNARKIFFFSANRYNLTNFSRIRIYL